MLSDAWIRDRDAHPKQLPTSVDFTAADLAPLRKEPAWDPKWDATALGWGRHLYVALDLLRLGYVEAARHEMKYLLRTLGAINQHAQRTDPRLRELVVTDVARRVFAKLGPLAPAGRAAIAEFGREFIRLGLDQRALSDAGRVAIADERRYLARAVFAVASTGVVVALGAGAVIASHIETSHPLGGLGVFACYLGYGGLVLAGHRRVYRCFVPKQTKAGEPNVIAEPIAACEDLFTGVTLGDERPPDRMD